MPKKETKTLATILLLVNILYIGSFVFLLFFTKSLIAESINIEDQIKIELKKEDMRILMKEDIASGKIYEERLMDYLVSSIGTVGFIESYYQGFSMFITYARLWEMQKRR